MGGEGRGEGGGEGGWEGMGIGSYTNTRTHACIIHLAARCELSGTSGATPFGIYPTPATSPDMINTTANTPLQQPHIHPVMINTKHNSIQKIISHFMNFSEETLK